MSFYKRWMFLGLVSVFLTETALAQPVPQPREEEEEAEETASDEEESEEAASAEGEVKEESEEAAPVEALPSSSSTPPAPSDTPTTSVRAASNQPSAPPPSGSSSAPATEEKKTSSEGVRPAFLLYGKGSAQVADATSSDTNVSGTVGGGIGYESHFSHVKIWYNKGTIETVGATLNDDGTVEDAEVKDYGRTILDPLSSDVNYGIEAGILPILITSDSPLKPRLGFSGYLLGSNLEWTYPNADRDGLLTKGVSAIALGGCVGVLGRTQVMTNDARLGGDLCATYRIIGGDVGNDEDLRQELLGNNASGYYGAELHVIAGLAGLSLDFKVLYLTGGSGSVDGITGPRLVSGVTGVAPIRFLL